MFSEVSSESDSGSDLGRPLRPAEQYEYIEYSKSVESRRPAVPNSPNSQYSTKPDLPGVTLGSSSGSFQPFTEEILGLYRDRIQQLQGLLYQQQFFSIVFSTIILFQTAAMAGTRPGSLSPGMPTPSREASPNPALTEEAIRPMQIVHMPMPPPGSAGAPFFDGSNITDFIDDYSIMCCDYGVMNSMQLKRMPKYCTAIIAAQVKALPEYTGGDWDAMARRLSKDYIDQDVNQKIRSRAYLEQYKQSSPDKKEGLKNYCRQFRSLATQVIEKKELDEYTACLWFIQGLMEKRRAKVVKKGGIKMEEAVTYKLERLIAAAEVISEEERGLKFLETRYSVEDLRELVEQRRQSPVAGTSANKPEEPTLTITKETRETRATAPVRDVDDLTKAFKSLSLPMEIKIDQLTQLIQSHSLSQQQPSVIAQGPVILPRPQQGPGYGRQPYGQQAQGYSSYPQNNKLPGYQGAVGSYGRSADQIGNRNMCHFCNEYGHHRRACPSLIDLINKGEIYLNESLRICWGRVENNGAPLSLDNTMTQLDSVRMSLQERDRRQNAQQQQDSHTANQAGLRYIGYDSDTDLEEDDFAQTFEYSVRNAYSNIHDSDRYDMYAASQDSQTTRGRGRPPKSLLLDKTAKITKERIQKEKGIATPKTMRSGQYGNPIFGIPEQTGTSSNHKGPSVEELPDNSGDSDATMEIEREDTQVTKQVRFTNKEPTKDKGKGKAVEEGAAPKIKNVKLMDRLATMGKDNPTQVVKKLLDTVVTNITVEDLLTSGSVHKLMFKPAKPDIIDKIQVNAVGTVQLSDVLYSSASPRAMVQVNGQSVSVLLDTGAEVNLIEESLVQRLGVAYTVDQRMKLVDVNGNETVLRGICENIEISIGPVSVVQSLLVVERASQPMILGMPYTSATSVRMQFHPSGKVEIEATCPETEVTVRFEGARAGKHPKKKYLSHLFPNIIFDEGKD